jgi:hypothetical protein
MLRILLAGVAALARRRHGRSPRRTIPPTAVGKVLVEVKSKKLDDVYLRPQADFRGYTKVMIDPTEVSFKKNWLRDQNRDRMALSNRVDERDARRILDEAQQGFQRLFAEAYTKEGYEVVTAPRAPTCFACRQRSSISTSSRPT